MNSSFFSISPVILAHRGDSKFFPENTMPAFKSASDLGVDCIETDAHLTIDGICILWHDDTVKTETGEELRICSTTFDELKKVDAGRFYSNDGGKTYPFRDKGIGIVQLEELLETLPKMKFNIDLKDKSNKLVKKFAEIIGKYRASDRVLGASFHNDNLLQLREIIPELPTSFSEDEVRKIVILQKTGLLRFSGKLPAQAFQVPVKSGKTRIITRGMINSLHKKGIYIHVWTINREEEMEELLDSGVDGIFTDDPRLLINIVKGRT